ncbi:hypothetical protein HOLleu_03340 [Holothuria leucospilota]|uniref:Uncharacterized protein n=1 Tax=Holothuria leucospilota TaxID=206669 RepID=A0A9Q1CTI7_HOLLE|nr:hypothetical protein HOLleu_03340 [Holothuria leucospilota]
MEATNSKAKSLTEVLVDRGVPDETIEELKKEKVGVFVLVPVFIPVKQEVGSDETVADLYNTFKTPLLRLYLATKWKVESTEHEIVDLSSGDSESFIDPFESFESFDDLNVASEIEIGTSASIIHEACEDYTLNEPLVVQGDSGTPTIQFNTVQRDSDPPLNSTLREQVIIRRSNVVEDFIQICLDPNIMSKALDVRMIHMNGDVEVGEGDGVFRDPLTEFWWAFSRYTNGNVYKIPIIRHDFGKEKWEAIARILLKGFKDTGYFPIMMAPAFMEECIFGIQSGDILESFMHYVSDFERDVLQKALPDFPEDTDELLNIMDGYECQQIPKPENLVRLLQEIAHKELIQKPMFIVDCWRPVITPIICHDLDQKRVWSLYTDLAPTVKKVTGLIKTHTELSGTEKVMLGYVKKYIRSLSVQDLQLFLRFCTGSDILICPSLYITFNQQDGFGRSVAHTCTTTVETPTTYESFAEFKK